ncbi:hypothetical protein F3P66_09205 [Agrobacterium fabrum]|uniref:Uncharacterized protein n=1 Tax=Agrobacterium fabrum (strain C58 / ATCC 33970) TaxID=176299 RepID=Q8UGL1_AGRFC|nr:hypothetical protein Atu1026 [Agrobacterium fabrum str. C58]QRM59605.1 hypothetical protein F3P66_09205 [Agrobacterium fabrum]TRB31030.1 hypothetical protein EXN51_02340 [Agrobacterium fabrum]
MNWTSKNAAFFDLDCQRATHAYVILGLVPRICNALILLTWLDPRDKPEDDVEWIRRRSKN